MANVAIVLGRDLTAAELRVINYHRKQEFDSRKPIPPAKDSALGQIPYFLLQQDGKLAAFGRLHDIQVDFRGERYEILGVATVIAIVKNQGFGRELMHEMKRYIAQSGKTAIGFCDPKVFGFYEKCGYSILPGGKSRFRFIQDRKELPVSHPEDDVLYRYGRDELMKKVLANPTDQITAFWHPW